MAQIPEELKNEIKQLIAEGSKIEAIKKVRASFGLGLKEAKEFVDILERDIAEEDRTVIPQRRISQRVSTQQGCVGKFVPGIFILVGIVFLVITVVIISADQRIVNNGYLTEGEVVGLLESDGAYAPVVNYEFDGEIFTYESATYSNPSSFALGETVPLFLDPDNPYDILIDTFSERWLLPVILGGMGLVFFVIGMVVLFVLNFKGV